MNNVNSGPAFSYTPYQAMASDGSTNFGYDGLGRMSSAGGTNYQNDAFDRQRSVGSTTIHYDGFSQAPAIETTAGTDKVYALDPFGRPKAVQNGSATPEYLTDDGHGNIANVTGSTQGVTCSVQYDPGATRSRARAPATRARAAPPVATSSTARPAVTRTPATTSLATAPTTRPRPASSPRMCTGQAARARTRVCSSTR